MMYFALVSKNALVREETDRQMDSLLCHSRCCMGSLRKGHSGDIPHRVKGQERDCVTHLDNIN